MLMVPEEFLIWPTECEYCNDDGRVLYFWRGDVWCARCLLEDLDDLGLMFESMQPELWQTPDGYYRWGRQFKNRYPKMSDSEVDHILTCGNGSLTRAQMVLADHYYAEKVEDHYRG